MNYRDYIIIIGPTLALLVGMAVYSPDKFWSVDRKAETGPSVSGWLDDVGSAQKWVSDQISDSKPSLESSDFAAPPGMQPAQPQMMNVAQTQPAPPTGGLLDFERAPEKAFSGTVQQVSELQQKDGQIHVWLSGPNGVEQEISVGPSWFLRYIGCEIAHDSAISGVGFYFDNIAKDPVIYAQKITLNGRLCQLRNDEGFALWSNQLR
ncbi:MAG: hypothetical protein HQK86_02670 [Nitrospinae bacterium]|nr:hypothetical protein [Nitrospinota bacterium]MBF0634352.1 hypothetical protein [Nitrospinota bacterium]